MNIEAVVEEIRQGLATIPGLKVPPWGVEAVTPPAALVALPDIDYDSTYGRGADRYPDLPVIVLAGKPGDPATVRRVAGYADGSGPTSIKAVLEAHEWVACDTVRVTRGEFDTLTYANTPYLALILHLDVTGKGT